MRFLFDSAVVGVAAGGLLREKRTHTDGKNTCGEKYARREERQGVQKIQAESVRLVFTGKFGGGFTRRVRRRIGRNGRRKSSARGRGEKTGRKCSVPTKTVAGKVSRGQGEACARTGTENCGKTGKNELFLWIFHTNKENKGKKNAKNGLKKRNAVNLLAKYGQS